MCLPPRRKRKKISRIFRIKVAENFFIEIVTEKNSPTSKIFNELKRKQFLSFFFGDFAFKMLMLIAKFLLACQ